MRNMPATQHQLDPPGIGPKKTFFVLVTVVGCIAILWPKVFYPMMLGGGVPKQPGLKGHHGTVACCDVVLDRDTFMNISKSVGERSYRKKLGLLTPEFSLRQERPPHLRVDGIHPAMLEKGRAIPTTHTVPLVSRPSQSAPIIVEGRPGPIPGLRPPLGAGSVHKAQPKGSSMGFIMPLYTVGIIAFFVYTIMKLLLRKPVANAPYGPARADPTFRKHVFNEDQSARKRPDDGTTKLGWKEHETRPNHQQLHDSPNNGQTHANGAISSASSNNHQNQLQHQLHHYRYQPNLDQINNVDDDTMVQSNGKVNREREQLMEIEKLRRKLEETEQAMAKLITEMGCDPYKAKDIVEHTSPNSNLVNGHAKSIESKEKLVASTKESKSDEIAEEPLDKDDGLAEKEIQKKSEHSNERSVQVLGMEMTASCEGGQRWGRPPTPMFTHRPDIATEIEPEEPESIYLEGALPRESQILVADSETRTENVIDEELNGTPDEPAVVLSSKMTLSLINLSAGEEPESSSTENDSPIGDDIEIINGSEKEDGEEEDYNPDEHEREDVNFQ